MEITIDQEFKNLIPPLSSEELSQLSQNIKNEGCRDPLVVWKVMPEFCGGILECDGSEFEVRTKNWDSDEHEDRDEWFCTECNEPTYDVDCILVDGHNRYSICKKHDIHFDVVHKFFADRSEALLWIIDNQFGRRNLAPYTIGELVLKRKSIIAAKAKENQKARKGDQAGATCQNSDKLIDPIDTKKELAKATGGRLSHDTIAKVDLISKHADEETKTRLRNNEISIHRVAKDIKEKNQKAKRDTQRKEAAEKVEPQFFDNLHIGDFREQSHKVADGSLSLIFTDPPYDRDALELFDGLGKFAADKLCEGGSLVAYVGHIQLPKAVEILSKHMRYWWICCCLHAGSEALMSEYGIRVGWKPMLWFVKKTRDDKQAIVRDVVSGGKEKSHHDWQQSQFEAEYWISELCPKDGIVCDPFLGGGTTAAAAIRLQRKWIGFEVDHDQAVLAMTRVKA